MKLQTLVPKKERWLTSNKVHWPSQYVFDQKDRIAERFHKAVCGKSVLGSIEGSDNLTDVTCPECQSELAAQALKDEAMRDDLAAHDRSMALGTDLDKLAFDRFGLHRGPNEDDKAFRRRITMALTSRSA